MLRSFYALNKNKFVSAPRTKLLYNQAYFYSSNKNDSRIGKVYPSRTTSEDLQKQELEANKRYVEKWWLKMNLMFSVSLFVIVGTFLFGSKDETKQEEPAPEGTTKIFGWNIQVETIKGNRPPFMERLKAGPFASTPKDIQRDPSKIKVLPLEPNAVKPVESSS